LFHDSLLIEVGWKQILLVIAPIEQFLCQSEKNGKIILLYRQNHYFLAFT